MNQQLYVSNFSSTLASGINASATSATLASGAGALLPTLANGDYLLLTLTQPGGQSSETSWEVIKVTAVTGDVLTIGQRAVEGTAASWATGSVCRLGTTGTGQNALSALGSNRVTQALGSTSGTTTIDLNGAGTISFTVGAATTLAFSNPPAQGATIEKTFYVTNGGAFTLNYPASSRFAGPGIVGSAPTLVASGTEILRMKATNFSGSVTYDWAYIGRVA